MEPSCNDNNVFTKLVAQSHTKFDYEVNYAEFTSPQDDKQIFYLERSVDGRNYSELNYDRFWDSTVVESDDCKGLNVKKKKANLLKRLVSKKKNRFQDENFDLDLAYITKRVVAMGYPSTGCETLWRNNAEDVKKWLKHYHKEVKVYNLCLEKSRFYDKSLFPEFRVGFFPFTDHEPCPIKLMLDFCVDLCLYLTMHQEGVAAIHCKAGKGRTGVMCICYLIFSGLCSTSDEAISHYAEKRTKNKKVLNLFTQGVTISSQIRYIKYFETFLSTNFAKPYYKMTPKIMRYYINDSTVNIIKNYITDDSYFVTKNKFILNLLKIGPFNTQRNLDVKFSSLLYKKIVFSQAKCEVESSEDGSYYYLIYFNSDFQINFDLSLDVRHKEIKFYLWMNLWYSTLDIISKYIYRNKLFLKDQRVEDYRFEKAQGGKKNSLPSFVEMKNMFFEFKNMEEVNHERFDQKYFCIKQQSQPLQSYDTKSGLNAKVKVFEDSSDKLIEQIDTLQRDSDLGKLIDGMNIMASQRNVKLFDKNNLIVKLRANELDKFKKAKNMMDNFKVELHYKLES